MMIRKSLLPATASSWGVPAIGRLRKEMDELFDDFFGSIMKSPDKLIFDDIQSQSSFPKINVSETETAYGVEIAIAGFNKADVNLELKDNVLIINAEKKEENEESEKNYLRKEISSRSFYRAVKFPEKVDTDNIISDYKDGIININLGKFKEPEKTDHVVKIKVS